MRTAFIRRAAAMCRPQRTSINAPGARYFSGAPHDEIGDAWVSEWTAATDIVGGDDVTYEKSAEQLRALIKTGLLRFTDLRDKPARFFEAHRILARHANNHGPGFWPVVAHHDNFADLPLPPSRAHSPRVPFARL